MDKSVEAALVESLKGGGSLRMEMRATIAAFLEAEAVRLTDTVEGRMTSATWCHSRAAELRGGK